MQTRGFYDYGLMLYMAFTEKRQAITVPEECVDIAQAVCRKIGWRDTQVKGADVPVKPFESTADNKIMVALSGGLDSAYLMHRLIEQGYEVTALHVAGINKGQAIEEAKAAREAATKAGAHYRQAFFKPPRNVFPDNPFKNQLIMSIMLEAGARDGICKYALGSDWTTPLEDAVVGFTITDSIEVNRGFVDGIRAKGQKCDLVFIDDDVKKQGRIEHLYRKDALTTVSRCVSPHRFRTHLHNSNEQKYGVTLMPGRCGSCYKCAMEYLLMADAGLVEANRGYTEHCWDILATAKTSHRPDLFAKKLPTAERMKNLREYGS